MDVYDFLSLCEALNFFGFEYEFVNVRDFRVKWKTNEEYDLICALFRYYGLDGSYYRHGDYVVVPEKFLPTGEEN